MTHLLDLPLASQFFDSVAQGYNIIRTPVENIGSLFHWLPPHEGTREAQQLLRTMARDNNMEMPDLLRELRVTYDNGWVSGVLCMHMHNAFCLS